MARHLLADQNQFRASAPPSWALNLQEISLVHCYCFIIYTNYHNHLSKYLLF